MAGNHVIGATLVLRDNMSATLRGVRQEQQTFRQDVARTRREMDRAFQRRLDTTAATQSITRLRTAMEPLRRRIVSAVAVRDNATANMRRIRNEANALGRRVVSPVVRVRDAATGTIRTIEKGLKALKPVTIGVSIAGAAAAGAGALALKSGAQLEQQQIAMKHFIGVNNQGKSDTEITAMRDSYMKNLRENANATPFTTQEVVGAGSRAVNIMGGNTKGAMDLVKLSEDMAALNPEKSLSDAMEALADAKNGEFERMKEFGFKISAQEFKGFVGKGANDALTGDETTRAYQMLVNQKLSPFFKGGAEEQANTGAGLLSTIKGKIGSKVQDVGLGMLERLKPSLQTVIGLIDKYSPQMDKFGLKIADGVGFALGKLPALKQYLSGAYEKAKPVITWVSDVGIPKVNIILGDALGAAKGVYDFFVNNWSTLKPFIEGIGIAFLTYKGIMSAIEVVTIAVSAAQLALNAAMNMNPIGLVVVAVGLLIGAGIALYKNWDTVKEKASDAWVTIENAFKTGINGAIDLINGLIGAINKIPGVNVPLIAKVKMSKTTSQQVEDAKKAGYTDNWAINGSHANGLDYVPFDGYIAELHKGERVQTASDNPYNHGGKKEQPQKTITIGSLANTLVVREEADIDKIANKLALKLDIVAANM